MKELVNMMDALVFLGFKKSPYKMKYIGISFVIAIFFYMLLIVNDVHEIKKSVLKCEIMLLKNEVK